MYYVFTMLNSKGSGLWLTRGEGSDLFSQFSLSTLHFYPVCLVVLLPWPYHHVERTNSYVVLSERSQQGAVNKVPIKMEAVDMGSPEHRSSALSLLYCSNITASSFTFVHFVHYIHKDTGT